VLLTACPRGVGAGTIPLRPVSQITIDPVGNIVVAGETE
jgi:hypothetical protein